MLLFKHMPYDEVHKPAIKNIAYTVVQQAARPVQATTASQTVNHQAISKVIFPLKNLSNKVEAFALGHYYQLPSYPFLIMLLRVRDVLGSYHKEKSRSLV